MKMILSLTNHYTWHLDWLRLLRPRGDSDIKITELILSVIRIRMTLSREGPSYITFARTSGRF